jgi:hypothetical protein
MADATAVITDYLRGIERAPQGALFCLPGRRLQTGNQTGNFAKSETFAC